MPAHTPHKFLAKPKPTIYYPDTDHQPVPDGEYQFPLLATVFTTLNTHFSKIPGARVNGNVFLYYEEGNPRKTIAPDCYVVFGLTPESFQSLRRHNTYLIWEVGKPPDFVMEIGSHSTKRSDLVTKRVVYASIGVSEYWRYDQTGGNFYGEPLVGERLVNGEYQRLPLREDAKGRIWAHSDAINLDLYWDDGKLRFWDPVAKERLLSHSEEHAARLAERARRLAAESRAAKLRADRIAAESRIQAAQTRLAEPQPRLRRRRGAAR